MGFVFFTLEKSGISADAETAQFPNQVQERMVIYMTIVRHELKQNLITLLIWSLILGSLIFTFMLMFPAFKNQMGQMENLYKNMGSFSAAFGLNKISFATAIGFYGIEAGTMIALGGSMFAALTGASALSKEEGGHTAEFLLTHPVSRVQIIAEKLIFITVQIVLFNLICVCCALASFAVINESVDKNLWLFHAGQLILQLEVAYICFGISAFQKRANIGLGLGFAAVLYFMSLFVNASKDAEFLKYITPFQYADAANIFPAGHLDGGLVAIGCGIAVAGAAAAFIWYSKKDISC